MEITEVEYAKISHMLPKQRGHVVNLQLFLNALLYAVENGCKWRQLPGKYGKWNTIYCLVKFKRVSNPLNGKDGFRIKSIKFDSCIFVGKLPINTFLASISIGLPFVDNFVKQINRINASFSKSLNSKGT